MYFHKTITLPRNTMRTSCESHTLDVAHGIIRRVLIGFPYGCAGLVGVRVLAAQMPIAPLSLNEYIAWDNHIFPLVLDYELDVEPYELTIEAYNEDDTYEHSIFIGVEMDKLKKGPKVADIVDWIGGRA